jgi:tripartite-type tricarboxylate transporter receptor subunit TctC
MVVPLAPGGGSDIVGRILAQALSDHWGKSVVVDNRPGAGSAVGTSIAAKAAPDGYTTLVSSSSMAISPALYKNLDFDVSRDFAGVTLIASQPSMLVVHPSVKAATVKELLALAKASPGKLPYASAGIGSATHLGTELLLYASKVEMLQVPYKSAGLATSALVSGEAQVLLTNMASVLPHVASGRLTALGISSAKRSALAPAVPTLSESGLPGFEYATWYGMLVPARTPQDIIGYLQNRRRRC